MRSTMPQQSDGNSSRITGDCWVFANHFWILTGGLCKLLAWKTVPVPAPKSLTTAMHNSPRRMMQKKIGCPFENPNTDPAQIEARTWHWHALETELLHESKFFGPRQSSKPSSQPVPVQDPLQQSMSSCSLLSLKDLKAAYISYIASTSPKISFRKCPLVSYVSRCFEECFDFRHVSTQIASDGHTQICTAYLWNTR